VFHITAPVCAHVRKAAGHFVICGSGGADSLGTPSKPTWNPSRVLPDGTPIAGQPRIFECSSGTLNAVSLLLHPRSHASICVVPAGFAFCLRWLWDLLWIPLSFATGAPAAVAGTLAIALLFAEVVWKLNSAQWLSNLGLFDVAYLLGAFWIGNLARLTLVARFHLRIERARAVFRSQRDSAIGLIALLAFWTPHATGLLLGWAFVAIAAGWAVADQYCRFRAKRNPGFLRPDE
jgi:hypothetical protein